MPTDGPVALRQRVNRREFLRRAGCGAGMGVLIVGAGRARLSAQPVSPYPDWIPPSSKPPKPGGVLTRAVYAAEARSSKVKVVKPTSPITSFEP